jgi:hypothetical protein
LSPFRTYGEAQKAIGLPAKNRTVSRYIDTGKWRIQSSISFFFQTNIE